ncbi:DUF6389 family protein [Roseibacillus persicicus]|uniref:DUF6389 family protein n=1 Tax=Roseibacillus persicicus TaxID=454148 RepID=UPI00280C5406|nr:DUF6389 family protein [Roseibacillus persicicus]MDQ8192738.1 DUF6389 family protein [Roseibacillus persicicus]
MLNDEYREIITDALSQKLGEIDERLRQVVSKLPESTKELHLYVFVDQDGEGFITVRASLDGPDLHPLNQEIRDVAELFDQYVPHPEGEIYQGDFIVDTVIGFLEGRLNRSSLKPVSIPVSLFNPEGYGTVARVKLN